MEDELVSILNFEIAKELLYQQNSTISDDEVREIYEKCNGNPYNAPILFKLLQIAGGKMISSGCFDEITDGVKLGHIDICMCSEGTGKSNS